MLCMLKILRSRLFEAYSYSTHLYQPKYRSTSETHAQSHAYWRLGYEGGLPIKIQFIEQDTRSRCVYKYVVHYLIYKNPIT